MSFGQFLTVLRARWVAAFAVFVLTVGTTFVVSIMVPKKYTAVASIVADVKPDPVSGFIYGLGTKQFLATQVDVMMSGRVLQRVVRGLKLTEDPTLRSRWLKATDGAGSFEGWVASELKDAVDIKPSLESNVITVSYVSDSRMLAATVANGFVRAYLDVALEMKVDPARQTTKFFDVQVKAAREALEKAQDRLSAYQKDKGVIVTEDRYDVESARLSELSTQLVILQSLSLESGSRQAQARGGESDRLQEVLNNPVIANLKADLSRAEARLQELSSRLGDNHPQVIEAKANVNTLRSRMSAETSRVTGGVGVTAAINRQREAELRAALEAQRAKVQKLRTLRDEGSVLLRDVESARRAYDTLLGRLNQTSLESQTTQSNVYVLADASPPSEPSSPKVLLNTALSVVLGGLLAAGAALALEAQDRRVRGVEDLATSLGLPVVGILPRPGAKSVEGAYGSQLVLHRLMGRLPPPRREA